eukprot:symbB.v1.2.033374.t1/scaffold4140.1/size44004/3
MATTLAIQRRSSEWILCFVCCVACRLTGRPEETRCQSCCPSDTFSQQGGVEDIERQLAQQPQLQKTLRTHHEMLDYIEAEYEFGIVADLDINSRDPQEFIWRSYLKKGRVVRLSSRPQRDRFTVVWDEDLGGVLDHWFLSGFSPLSRSWNCSHLQQLGIVPWSFRNLCCLGDSSWHSVTTLELPIKSMHLLGRWVIADGNGNEPKPFKAEWAVIKDDHVWLGSIGFEWYGKSGEILHRNAEWVKVIDFNGMIRNLDWHPVYQAVRTVTNTTLPGYLWHEAVEWEPAMDYASSICLKYLQVHSWT